MAPTVPPQEVFSSSRRWQLRPAVVLTLAAALSCGGDETIPPDPPEPTRVTVSPGSLQFAALRDTARLSAQVHDQYGDLMADAAVTWASSDASVASVDSEGLVRSVGNGEAVVTATSGSAADSATVTVAQVVSAVGVSPAALEFSALGDTLRLAAEPVDANGYPVEGATVMWASGDTAVAVVDAWGLVRSVGNGEAVVTATAGSVSGTAEATVEQVVTAMNMSPLALEFSALGDTLRLGAEPVDANGHAVEGATVMWASGDTAVAVVDTSGLVSSVGNGEAVVMATAGSVSGTAEVTVAQVVGAVNLSPAALEFSALGDTLRLGAEPVDVNGHPVERATVMWASGDTAIAVVDASGLVRSVGNGEAVLSATADSVSGTAVVMVGQVVRAVTVSPEALEFSALGDTVLLRTEVFDANGRRIDGATVTWASGNTAVARVDASGLVRSVGNGEATVSATADSVAGAAEVTVAQVARTVVVSPANVRLTVLGAARDLAAEASDANGHAIARTAFTWASGDESVVTVDGAGVAGVVEAVGYGVTTVTATLDSASGSARITVRPNPDRAALAALYSATGGPDWNNNRKWLTEAPVGDWYGVRVEGGRVVKLDLTTNGLTGPIPPELGKLSELREMRFHGNKLSGPIPPEFGELSNLRWIQISSNTLTGAIPPQLGELSNLTGLFLFFNKLSGPIPPELGELSNLEWLGLSSNSLTGAIPPGLGRLSALKGLSLSANELTGAIPGELGELSSLQSLRLDRNRLTSAIPPELGKLSNLAWLVLQRNKLAGPIPPELGNLSNLYELQLQENSLTDTVPPGLGRLSNLEWLWLWENDLEGAIPPEFSGMTELREMILTGNAKMSGALPMALTTLGELDMLMAGGTDLCAPADSTFLEWLRRVHKRRLAPCFGEEGPSAAYLTQAVQSREYPVPLVADEKALLRVFVTAGKKSDATIPTTIARFYLDDEEIYTDTIPGKSTAIPTEVDEGDLSKSANAEIPDSVIQPGLEMVIEIDPNSTLDPELGVAKRIPKSGRLAVRVHEMPSLNLTMIPFLWTSDPDSAVLDITEGIADNPATHDTLRHVRTLLPVAEIVAEAHEAVVSSTNSAFSLLSQTRAIRVMEEGTGYYMGMMTGPVTGAFGIARVPGRTSFAYPVSHIIGHELGHNMNLNHAPCGDPAAPDPSFPQPDGSIGAWGYDFGESELVSSGTRDLMSYCNPRWISDYHFANASRFRLSDDDNDDLTGPPPAPSLLLWGGLSPEGKPFLEPVLVVDAPPVLPEAGGEYGLTGQAADGTKLFSLDFQMAAVADGEGESGLFVFALPVRPGWAGSLASLTLSAPGGSITMDGETDRPLAILRHPQTGRVRAILRNLAPEVLDNLAARAPAPGLDIFWSRGIPDADAWKRQGLAGPLR